MIQTTLLGQRAIFSLDHFPRDLGQGRVLRDVIAEDVAKRTSGR